MLACVARVTVRVRGGKTLSAPPVRGNVYDLSDTDAVAIQPARWFDRQRKPIRRPWRT